MKHLFGYASVFALAAGFSLSSCSSDDAVESAPDFSGNGEAVKTQFSIAVPGSSKSSRMTDDETQQDEKFNGMTGIHVFTFKGAKTFDESQLAGAEIKGHFTLDDVTTNNDNTGLTGDAKARVYTDVNIDAGVDRLLFYGVSSNTGVASPVGQLEPVTALNDWAADANVSFINFKPVQVFANGVLGNTDQAKGILAFLNGLYNRIEGTFDSFNNDTGAQEESTTSVEWKNADDSELKDLFTKFKTLKNGSAEIVKFAAADLYSRLKAIDERLVYGEFDTSHEVTNEAVAKNKNIVKGLLSHLGTYFTEVSNENGVYTLKWNESKLVLNGLDKGFPADLGLPTGVALLKWTEGNKPYSFVTEAPSNSHSVAGGSKNSTVAREVVHPAALYYYANSDLAVANHEMLNTLGNQTWDAFITSYNDNLGIVNLNTRSVSMRKQINYGVSQLRTKVQVASGIILDNTPAEEGQHSVTIAQPFEVTGILVGGQKTVDWKFEQSSTINDVYTIYDNAISGMKASQGEWSNVNTTLVLESSDVENQKDVYIAVEFVNTNEDFTGADGVVKKGAKFYLVAPLKFKADPSKLAVTKIFQKDYFTNANLTIKHLKNAYINVPDLRAPQMEFGMSVDLQWQEGLTFDTEFD